MFCSIFHDYIRVGTLAEISVEWASNRFENLPIYFSSRFIFISIYESPKSLQSNFALKIVSRDQNRKQRHDKAKKNIWSSISHAINFNWNNEHFRLINRIQCLYINTYIAFCNVKCNKFLSKMHEKKWTGFRIFNLILG